MLAVLRREPAAVYFTAASVILGLVFAFTHFTHIQQGYITAIVGGVAVILVAALARPINLTVIYGAAATVLSSLVVFNVHLSQAEVGAVVAAVGLVLGLVVRQHLTPVNRA
jgi:hypothetical protein